MSMLFSLVLAASLIGPLDRTVVSPEWLQNNLNNPDVVIVEIGDAAKSDHPHIPGAHFVSITDIVTPEGWPPEELPPVKQLEQAFGNAGVGDTGRIILYSANPQWATRAWFTLDYLGQGDRTAILDGGSKRWKEERRPMAMKRFAYLAKTFTGYPDSTRLVPLSAVKEAMAAGGTIIDARSGSEFYGFKRGQRVMRRGHIPGAHCEPWAANLQRDGSFRSPAELKAQYEALIGKPSPDPWRNRVIVYCRTGMEATVPYFVLRSLGYDVALFDGSYTEWAREGTLPVAKLTTKP